MILRLLLGCFISHCDLCWGSPPKQVSISKHSPAFSIWAAATVCPSSPPTKHGLVSALLLFWFHSRRYRDSHLSRRLLHFPLSLCLSVVLYHLHLIPASSLAVLPLLSPLTRFSSLADSRGRVHAVRHDGRDQTQLDRGSKEERAAQRLSRSHTVTSASMWNRGNGGTWLKLFGN